MAYMPFARKYRPQTFEELIGQPHLTTTLMRALKSKSIFQAYLFAGQRGVGKTSAARILAKCLNCEEGPSATPCNKCAGCEQISRGCSLDVIEIDGASNRGIDDIRSLRETVGFAPAAGSYRVYIIDEVHMLTVEAFNALLKTLEEPPAHVKFIFATTAASKVPATILSRCQRFDFRRIESSIIVKVLARVAKTEKVKIDEAALYTVARAADGSLRDAEVILEQLASFVEGTIGEVNVSQLLGMVESDALMQWTQSILERDCTSALTYLTMLLEQGKDPAQLLISLLHQLRNLLIIRSTSVPSSKEETISRLIDAPSEWISKLREQAGLVSPQELLMLLQILVSAYEVVRRSPVGKTVLELAIIKLAAREQWQSLEQISRRLERLNANQAPPGLGSGGGATTIPKYTSHPSVKKTGGTESKPKDSVAQTENAAVKPLVHSEVSLDEMIAMWSTLLERLAAEKMSLAAYLAESRPVQVEVGTLTVGLPGSALHQEVVGLLENRRLIERLLKELCGVVVAIHYSTLPEQPTKTSDEQDASEPAPPIVQDIVKLFNATLLDRPNPT